MKKPVDKRTHRKQIEGSRGNMSVDQIRQTKNQRTKQRNLLRKKEIAEKMALVESRSPKEQLAVLDERLGVGMGAVKERKKLLKRLQEHEEKDKTSSRGRRRKGRGATTGAKNNRKPKSRNR
jgi:hypothetical protein